MEIRTTPAFRPGSAKRTCTRASSAASATAGSLGCGAWQGPVPKIARYSLSPATAGQPRPPVLWQGTFCRKYQQRMRWQRLPPRVAMLRIWVVPTASQAAASAGDHRRRAACAATSATSASVPNAAPATHVLEIDERTRRDEAIAHQRDEIRTSRDEHVAAPHLAADLGETLHLVVLKALHPAFRRARFVH